MQVWTDIHTADDWWMLQVYFYRFKWQNYTEFQQDKIGPEKVVIQMTLYTDAAKLDKLSRKKMWAVCQGHSAT